MKFSANERRNGEMAAHNKLTGTALRLYCETDPLNVYEYRNDSGTWYAYDGCLGSDIGLTMKGLQEAFEGIWEVTH